MNLWYCCFSDMQLKEQQAQLILERHSFEDREAVVRQLQREVETLKAKQQLFIDENNALSLKVFVVLIPVFLFRASINLS